MIRLFSGKPALSFLWLLMAICHLCADTSASTEVIKQIRQSMQKPEAVGQKSSEQPVAKPDDEESIIVAKIGDYAITKAELKEKLMMELRPRDYEIYSEEAEPADANAVLMEMVAEKAMMMEARSQGRLEDELVHASMKRFSERRLVNLLLQKHLQGKITVTEDEIKQKMQADPELDMAQAKAAIERAKSRGILDQYYRQIYQKSNVKKSRENFARVTQIHQRLLYGAKQPRKVQFIRSSQVKDELTPEEKNIVLAEYNRGKITLKDWFTTLCEIVPPRRPRDLGTTKGVEQLLEGALRMPLMVSEAKSLGLDKDKELLKQVRKYEDRRLLSEAKVAKQREVKEPTNEQMTAYFGQNKEALGTNKSLKIDLIWCEDLPTARKAKAELDSGKDFELVRQKYSLDKKGKPFNTRPTSEGLFWKDLWAGSPNEIVGPVKGFYREGIKWRIVKILEKKPGEAKEYSSDMDMQIKRTMMTEQRKTLVAQYGQELLKKYPYQIYADKIKDIDPLDIP